jgi:FkbM family methyltransferase
MVGVFPSCRYAEVRFNETGKLIGDLEDAWVRQYFSTGVFEPEFFQIASPMIPDGGVFFNVGANFGFCSFGLFAERRDRGIRFFLFEANPLVFECLKKSADLNSAGNSHLIPGCVLDRPGFSQFRFELNHTGGGSYLGPDANGVPNTVLDEFIEKHEIGCVDLLKLDIEGSEPLALAGAKNSLSRGVVKAIYIEVSAENLQRQGRTPSNSVSALRDSGFSPFWCKPEDFANFGELSAKSIRLVSDRGSFSIAPLDSFPKIYQTDILALHNNSSLMLKLRSYFSANDFCDSGIGEMFI